MIRAAGSRADQQEPVDFAPFTEAAPLRSASARSYSRRQTRPIRVGRVPVGGNAPITVQSMTKTDTRNVQATVDQIWALEAAGCEIVRVAVPDAEAAAAIGGIRSQIRIPLIVDIHFDYRLALQCLEAGVDCLRINPGNIGATWRVQEVTRAAAERTVPIRIGVNAGSLEKHLLQRFGEPTPEALVESALFHIRILEELNYPEMKISLKSSDPRMMIEAYRQLADKVPYPFHLGVTEAGTAFTGAIKSAVGIGSLLLDGIGDTIRVSLSAPPAEEIRAAKAILEAAGLREAAPEIVSCPTCGRTSYDLISMVSRVEEIVASVKRSGSRDGLRRQRSRGSQRSRLRHCRWRWRRLALCQRRDRQKGAGSQAGA